MEELTRGGKANTSCVTFCCGTRDTVTILYLLLHPNAIALYDRCGLTFRGANNALIRYVLLMAALQLAEESEFVGRVLP